MRTFRIFICLILALGWQSVLVAREKAPKPYFFVQLTDPQFGMSDGNRSYSRETEWYEKAVKGVNRLKPDFVVITGDLVNDQKNSSQIAEFKRITALISKKIPVWYTPGNHDIGNLPDSASIAEFIRNYGHDHFSFRHKNSLFVGINSGIVKNRLPAMEQKQYDWLAGILGEGKGAAHRVLFCHYPFFIRSFDEAEVYSNINPDTRKKYFDLFASGQVEAVFAGHLHNNATVRQGPTEMVTTSAVGMPHGKDPSGLRIVKVYPGKIEHAFYGLDELPEKITF